MKIGCMFIKPERFFLFLVSKASNCGSVIGVGIIGASGAIEWGGARSGEWGGYRAEQTMNMLGAGVRLEPLGVENVKGKDEGVG